MWICGPKALACCLVIAGRGAGRGSRMTLKGESRPFGLLMIGAAVALLAGCSASDGATVTSTAPSSSSSLSSPSPTVISTSSPSAVAEFRHGDETTGIHRILSLARRPGSRSSRLSAGCDRRLHRLLGVGRSRHTGSGQRTGRVRCRKWATGSGKVQLSSKHWRAPPSLGSTAPGRPWIDPQVTKVEPGLVTMTSVSTPPYTGFFDRVAVRSRPQMLPGRTFGTYRWCRLLSIDGGRWLVLRHR